MDQELVQQDIAEKHGSMMRVHAWLLVIFIGSETIQSDTVESQRRKKLMAEIRLTCSLFFQFLGVVPWVFPLIGL